MSFLDAYYGYKHIRMNESDRIHKVFITDRGLYCYKRMPFGLKNIRVTYQRLIKRMFARLLGKKVEAYIDDMVIKSKKSRDHINNVEKVFEIFQRYKMKLNPLKCTSSVSSEKFLDHVVSNRGIEPNPTQMKTLSEIEKPQTIWDVQSLARKIAALGRFISKILDCCKPFFQCKKHSTSLEWGEEQS